MLQSTQSVIHGPKGAEVKATYILHTFVGFEILDRLSYQVQAALVYWNS